MKTLSIIGAGRLGKTLGGLWARSKSFQIMDVLTTAHESAASAIAFIGAGLAVDGYADLRLAKIFLIATPDDQIVSACERLAAAGILASDSVVFHCSGSLPSSVLRPAIVRGAAVASIHPIRSFASPEEVVKSFAGTWCGMEGDPRALDVLIPAFEAIGSQLVGIDPDAKIHYHAAAVFACNYLVTLLDVAKQSYVRAGIDPETALKLMAPLVRETVENVFKLGPEAALTGPIARGDIATAYRQMQAVRNADEKHGELYKQFLDLTQMLAAKRFQ